MDKNAIKKFAVWARRELIARVSQKALRFGISADAAEPADATSINGKVLSTAEGQQRRALLKQVQSKGYEQVMEEVAYTWFNRFCALRFMEVNQYLPSRVRVFTNEEDAFKPQMIDEALSLELEGLSMEEVYAYKEANDKEGLFKYLLITQCNALSPILPQMFQHIADYTELLFPDNLLREGSVIHEMVTAIPTEDWQDAVQIIGWLYQFYISEKKDAVFAQKGKVSKDDIPARTQLFTPDWIVRYMVENSLGRLWVEGHPNEELKQQWRYFLEEAEQEPEVQAQLADIRKEYAAMKPEDIKCIDPCCGSGHILVYMFDVLVQIYESCGYTTRDAVRSIVEKNIYGLDIDARAAQLAYFAVMMKARQYDRRFLTRRDEEDKPDVPQPKVYAICESNSIDEKVLGYFANNDAKLRLALQNIVRELNDAKEYGSLQTCSDLDYSGLRARLDEIRGDYHILNETAVSLLTPLIQVAETLARKYDIAVTNPPYMESSVMSNKLQKFVNSTYPDSKRDLFAVFIERCSELLLPWRHFAMITQHSWMFLSSFEKLRAKMLQDQLLNMAHLGARAFEEIGGEVVQTTVFVQRTGRVPNTKGVYCRLVEPTSQSGKEEMFLAKENRYTAQQDSFSKIPGSPIAYWVSLAFISIFRSASLNKYASIQEGVKTADNDRFIRLWYEVNVQRTNIDDSCDKKWIKHTKGGVYRRWYGNNDSLLNYERNGEELRNFKNATLTATENFYRENITWTRISSGETGFRYTPVGSIPNMAGLSLYCQDIAYYLAFLNCKVATKCLNVINPTLNFPPGTIAKLPILFDNNYRGSIDELSSTSVKICRQDWDSFETSWDFKRHPLLRGLGSIQASFETWEREASERFYQLKANEEELNRIFIDIYGLQDELTPEVEEKDVTVRKADLGRDIRSLISYAVGCMFGRYSLDVEGLAYAGGEWDAGKYSSFPADKDNIIPICDDEYFEDDIVGRFVEFIRVAYGEDTLEENLRFIADALGGKGSAREVIRKYFRDDFYADHLKIYQKRPIYWQFDSGKKGGFRALVYMHRYAPDTIARIRTDYVHQQQDRYRTALEGIEQRMANASTSDRVKLSKVQKKLQDQDKELQEYEEKIHHLADQYICIDLDDGVKKNYALFSDVLTKIK